MKIYAVCTFGWKEFVTEEREVVKETPKTYVVKDSADKFWNTTSTIKKDTMESNYYIYDLTLDGIKEKLRLLLEKRINNNIAEIEKLKKKNEVYKEKLKDLKENKNNGNQ